MSRNIDLTQRRDWMGLIARAVAEDLDRLWPVEISEGKRDWLRAPETGTIMVQGRAGAVGAPFNLGEITVTRASLKLDCGAVGHAMVQGRSKRKAERAALLDALMQTNAADTVRMRVLNPLLEAEHARRTDRAEKAAATKVDFFTMVRGD